MAQGTIKEYDEQGRTGSLLMEDHTEVAIDAVSVLIPPGWSGVPSGWK